MDYNIAGKETKSLVKETWSRNNKNATYSDTTRQGKPLRPV
ncbi:hypothetical protein [Pedobacter arcticus]|nr:hypothetical protein [Pedobacter arcticus]